MKYIWLILIYGVTILVPYYLTTEKGVDPKLDIFTLQFGFIHIPSVVFIIFSALILHRSIDLDSNEKKALNEPLDEEIIEVIEVLSLDNEKRVEELKESKNPICQDLLAVIKHGGIEEDLELVIEKYVSAKSTVYEKLINEYGFIAAVLPMLGMIGTITGLLQMFAVNDGVDNFAEKFASLSVALATTLYATLWVVFVTKPKAKEVENRLMKIDHDTQQLVITSKLFLHNTALVELEENVEPSPVQIETKEVQVKNEEQEKEYF